MAVRSASREELQAVMTVFDSGNLAVTAEQVKEAIAADRVLVAVNDDRILGALLLGTTNRPDTGAIEAVAVRPGRRGQGLGTALVQAAAERHQRLTATFDARVRPFWTSLGFELERCGEPERYHAWVETANLTVCDRQ